eukprot:15439697-Heterocapsa_arctica.AAC.1
MAGSVACRTRKVKTKASVEEAAAGPEVPTRRKKGKAKSKPKPGNKECESQEQIKDTVDMDGGGQRDKYFVDDILD